MGNFVMTVKLLNVLHVSICSSITEVLVKARLTDYEIAENHVWI